MKRQHQFFIILLSLLATCISNETIAQTASETDLRAYENLQKYINMTKEFTDVSIYESKYKNGEYTTNDAETIRQELNVLRFNAASESYTNKVEVKGWTGDLANVVRNDQHWSNTSISYYDANSWTDNYIGLMHELSTELTLPAGSYMLKAAGRCSSETSLSLSILDEETTLASVEYTGKGDIGYGIDTKGNANFSKNGTYANNNGRGWEWEFAKFELSKETAVKLLVKSDYNDVQNCFCSFSDITLWMDDNTYINANRNIITELLSEATIWASTRPIGTNEKNALLEAISIAEGDITTPKELNDAIAILNTAIDNAEAWTKKYDTAKTPLVTALERFETEFNDGANGALRFIVTEDWKSLLNAVTNAAITKDITNSYTDFAQAAIDLETAMNEVYKSYHEKGMWERLTSLIANADCAENTAWTGSGRTTADTEHWSGNKHVYFTQNHESGAARSQTINLSKNGTYLLKVAVRAVESTSYVDIIIGGESYKVAGAHGRTGGTIATDGTEWASVAAGIKAGKTFANNNKGYGWVYQYIYFDAKAGECTIDINLSSINNGREANVGGMELYHLTPNYTVEKDNILKHYGEYDELAVTNTTHDITAATMSNINIDFSANPNALIIANEGQVSNESNVIINSTTNKLSLTDGYAFNATADFTATAVSYNREFTKGTWQSICLPFAYAIPTNVKVEVLASIDLDTKTFTFNEVTETMEANTPYLIKNCSEPTTIFASLNDVLIKQTPATMAVPVTAKNSQHIGELIGTYTPIRSDEMKNDEYDILIFGTNGELYCPASSIADDIITINPFYAYIRLPKGAINWSNGEQVRVLHQDSETTGIEKADVEYPKPMVIYDLTGRRVTTMEQGIYIVNGRKLIIK